MLPIASRNKAALCHLAPLTIVGSLLIPILFQHAEDECPDFLLSHARGAFYYQGCGLLVLGASGILGMFLWNPQAGFDHQMWLALGLVSWSMAGLAFILGLVYLAMQAWSGTDFDFGFFNSWVYGE